MVRTTAIARDVAQYVDDCRSQINTGVSPAIGVNRPIDIDGLRHSIDRTRGDVAVDIDRPTWGLERQAGQCI